MQVRGLTGLNVASGWASNGTGDDFVHMCGAGKRSHGLDSCIAAHVELGRTMDSMHYDHTRAEMRAQTLGESGERIALPGDGLRGLRGGQGGAELVLALVNVHLVRGGSKRGGKRDHNDNSTGAHSR
jgi:hypothetical protein